MKHYKYVLYQAYRIFKILLRGLFNDRFNIDI